MIESRLAAFSEYKVSNSNVNASYNRFSLRIGVTWCTTAIEEKQKHWTGRLCLRYDFQGLTFNIHRGVP